MAKTVTSRIMAGLILQLFTLCLSQSEAPDEECLLQNHLRPSASALDFQKEFADYVQNHGRRYDADSEEFKKRYALFAERFRHVQTQNQRENALWTAAVNTYTDRTEEELAQLRGWRGYRRSAGHVASSLPSYAQLSLSEASLVDNIDNYPIEKNYTDLETVRSNQDQGACGSCWAFAAAVTLQANAEKACRKRSFSPQAIVSCVQNRHHCGGTGGCEGATVELAFDFFSKNGLPTDEEEPYKARSGSCKWRKGNSLLDESKLPSIQHMNDITVEGLHEAAPMGASFGLTAWQRLPENKYLPLLAAVAKTGPVAVSVSASSWYLYNRGIFNSCEKDAVIDHAVTLIGYGKERDNQYWTIKNSWGRDWGENGNMRLLRKDDDATSQCGTDYHPEMGTGCDGGPSKVKVCGMCGILYDSVVPHFKKACTD